MDITNVRYMFEHKVLPDWIFNEKARFILTLIKNDNLPYQFLKDICEKEEIEFCYEEEQFEQVAFNITEEIRGICLIFPEPEREPLCFRSYIIFDLSKDLFGYYTVEKGNRGVNFLCGWDSESHLNYGTCPDDLEEETDRIVEIFLEPYKKDPDSNLN